jgi:NAD(P)-dependent dehydrogenase (short-subunit alcohol dehydrogenase family)
MTARKPDLNGAGGGPDGAAAGRLAGRIALVTGAARGIGATTARRFAAEGARVVLADVLDDEGATVAAELGERGLYRHLDVTDEAGWASAVRVAGERFGSAPTILVHNAGVMTAGTAEHADAVAMRRAFEVNVLGPAHRRRRLPAVRQQQGGQRDLCALCGAGARPVRHQGELGGPGRSRDVDEFRP